MPLQKILLVDDDKAYNFLNRTLLKMSNVLCQIDEVQDGAEALTYMESSSTCPDVIFLDINMPGIDGFEFLREFEERDKCCNRTSIFMLTSSQRDEDRQKALAHKSVKGFFDKPLSEEKIQEVLAMVG